MQLQTYFFLLGRTPELSLAELQAVTGEIDLVKVTSQIVSVKLPDDEIAQKTFEKLGGSLKLMKNEGEFSQLEEKGIIEAATAYLAQSERPTFAIAEFGRENIESLSPIQIKKSLKKRNVGSRFIEGPREGLSAAVLLHNDVVELNIIQIGEKIIFAKTLAVQDI